MNRLRALLLLVGAAAASPGPAAAQGAGARDVPTAAEELVRSGRTEEARTVAARALAECPPGTAGNACRQRLRFTLAWIAERRGASVPADARSAYLEEAARTYALVLDESPAHVATLTNLASVEARLGRRERAVDLLRRAARADPARTGAYALAEGDLERQDRRLDAARQAYDRAIAADPSDDTARLRIVDVYADSRSGQALYELCLQWEQTSLPAADAGYLAVIRASHGSQEALALNALVRWVDVEARLERLSPTSPAQLPRAWTAAPVEDLRRFLNDPGRAAAAKGWWTSNAPGGPPGILRRHVLARAALVLGRGARSRANEKGADAIWSNALGFAPQAYEYGGPLDGLPVVRLDLIADLMLLLSDDPSLDVRSNRFRLEENELFEGKGGAYRSGDLVAIQRYHTVLGLVYARRGVWSSSSRYRNALFQLEHAVSTAEQRAGREGRYQPVPSVRAMLADGYARTGQTRAARLQLLLAARDHLDTDDLPRAERLVADEAAQGGPGPDAALRDQLTAVLRARRASAKPDPMEALQELEPAHGTALSQPRSRSIDAAFLTRQRFKVLAQVAEVQRTLRSSLALEAAARALTTAADGSIALNGPSDLRRLEVSRAILETEGRLAVPRIRTAPHPAAAPAGDKVLPLVLPGEATPAFTNVDADVIVAARVVGALGAKRVQSPDLKLRVRAGELEMRRTVDAPHDPALAEKVRRLEGVTKVVETRDSERR
jgi:tetratricopeptide (TPR) repeat protein